MISENDFLNVITDKSFNEKIPIMMSTNEGDKRKRNMGDNINH